VVEADGRINLKKLLIGRDFGNAVEVLEGINPADSIVVNPPDSLEQGEPVTISPQGSPSSETVHSSPSAKP
jgi:hypothetical protein